MVGPDLIGLGGISRVTKIWRSSNLFSDHNVIYIASVTDLPVNRISFLLRELFEFTFSLMHGSHIVYVHTSSYNSFYRKSLFIWIALFFRKKIVLHIHPTHFYEFVSGVVGIEKRFIFFLLRRTHAIVVITEEMRRNIKSLFPDKLVYVLRNPVNLAELKDMKGYKRNHNRLLYLGWYIREKGVYELVDAVEILVRKGVKIHLDFYGTKQVEKLKQYVEYKQLAEHVFVNGWISGERKIEALYQCTMLILPSHSEGIPNVILEAMATMTPIIATWVGGLKEILQDGKNSIIAQASNPQDLSKKIEKCLDQEDLRKRIAACAYQDVTKYDIHVIKKEFARIVEKTVHG